MPNTDPILLTKEQVLPSQSEADRAAPTIISVLTAPSTTLLTTNSTPQEAKIAESEVIEVHTKLNELSELSNIQIAGALLAGIFVAVVVTLALVFTSGTDPISIIMYAAMGIGLGFGASYGLFYLLKEANSQARVELVRKICASPELFQELTKFQLQDLLNIKGLESLEKGKSEVESKLGEQVEKIKEQHVLLQKNQGSTQSSALEQLQKIVDAIAQELLFFSQRLTCHLHKLQAKTFSAGDVEYIRDMKKTYFSLQAKIDSAIRICPSAPSRRTNP